MRDEKNNVNCHTVKQRNSSFFITIDKIIRQIDDNEKYSIGCIMLYSHYEEMSKQITKILIDNIKESWLKELLNIILKEQKHNDRYDKWIIVFKCMLEYYNKNDNTIEIIENSMMKKHKDRRNEILHDGKFTSVTQEEYEELYEKLHKFLEKLLDICSTISEY